MPPYRVGNHRAGNIYDTATNEQVAVTHDPEFGPVVVAALNAEQQSYRTPTDCTRPRILFAYPGLAYEDLEDILPTEASDPDEHGEWDEHRVRLHRLAIPPSFHTPAWDEARPGAYVCAVCWGDGWMTAWPCQVASRENIFGDPIYPTRKAWS